MGHEDGCKADRKTCLDGNLEFFGLTIDRTTAAQHAIVVHDIVCMVEVEAGAGAETARQGGLASKEGDCGKHSPRT